MKRVALFVVATLLVAALVHVATVWELPRFNMSKAMQKVAGETQANAFLHPPLATDAARTVVRPSPDLAYSICVLDLSASPVRVTVPLTAPYTSVALYSSATDNYFVRNDRDAGGKALDVIVVAPGGAKPVAAPTGVDIVEAPTAKGLVLVRRVVENAEAFPTLDAVRKTAICAPFQG